MPPTSEDQIRLLVNLQRLLDEGQFTASYKFALLLALADLSVEKAEGDDSGAALTLSSEEIAGKFVQYYWRQVIRYPAAKGGILRQNMGRQAAIVNVVGGARSKYGNPARLMSNGAAWQGLVKTVARVVRDMPLRYLQNVGGMRIDFLYAEPGRVIELRPGVAFCFSEVSRPDP
jgi:hypothetical protein